MKLNKHLLLPCALFAACLSTAATGEALTGEDLQRAVAGKTVHVNTPMGEVPIRYSANGGISGRTQLALLDGETTTSDRGRWWIAGHKLCIRWQRWMGAAQHCFTMERTGAKTVRWHRDDGATGTARID